MTDYDAILYTIIIVGSVQAVALIRLSAYLLRKGRRHD